MSDKPTNAELKVSIDKVTDQLETLTNRINGLESRVNEKVTSIQNSIDLLFDDRKLLEKLCGQFREIQEAVTNYREHFDTMNRDVKNDISGVSDKVDTVKEEVKKTVDENLGAVVETISAKKSVVMVHDNFFAKLVRMVKKAKKEVN